ncbi:MAG TPA: VOC family protein [Blastocatellia bacterium]|nr:VOC family protein [Blastocatellia bacterium]
MATNQPENAQRITIYLYYEDVAGALDWLSRAFGFHEQNRMSGPDGSVAHAGMTLGDAVIMMGDPGPDYQNPKRLGHVTQSLYVIVDDVDKHYEQAKQAGAKIIEEPKDQFYGDRRYGAEDIEGHHWYFAQHLSGGAPEEMKQTA